MDKSLQDDEDVFPIALHESGHVVMAAVFAADIRFATVVPSGDFLGSCAWVRPRLECGGEFGTDWPQMVLEVAGCAAAYRCLDPSDDRIWLDDLFDDVMQDDDQWLQDVEEAVRAEVCDAHRRRTNGLAAGPQDLERAAERALKAAADDPSIATQILLRAATRATTELHLGWDTVVALADELCSRRTLDQDQIWTIIEGTPPSLPALQRPR